MESFFVSMLVVAVGEIGDKTQLLALILASRFRQPRPIILGIFVATLANHSLAGVVGVLIKNSLEPGTLHVLLAVSFFAIAAWAMKADAIGETPRELGRYGVFALTVLVFFVAEIGDKTQLATVALAAKYDSLTSVVAGSTLGMLIADAPAVLLAERLFLKIPLKLVRYVSAALFALLGVAALFGLGGT